MSGYILLVDDNPNNLRLLIAILREKGFEIRPATSGVRALAVIAREAPDLILLDINMPEMDGYEVCRRLKADQATADIPVLFISANDETVDKVRGFAAGGVDYITKPFQEAEVLARIDTQLTILHQRRQLEGILNSSLDGIVAYAAVRDESRRIRDFRWLTVNPAAARLLGASRQELLGQCLCERFPFVAASGLLADYIQVVETGETLDQERYIEPFGRWIHMLAVRLEDGLAVTFRDTTERKQLELALARQAEIDGLTGIANRRAFDAGLLREWQRCADAGRPLSLLMCDIDFFKPFNDRCGHLEGDRCLRLVAGAIHAALEPRQLAARYGGEEFGLILPESDAESGQAIAHQVAAAVAGLALPHPVSEHGRVSLSIGLASAWPNPTLAATELLHRADQALYRAKQAGRNRVEVWS